jgi:hypothetical protein
MYQVRELVGPNFEIVYGTASEHVGLIANPEMARQICTLLNMQQVPFKPAKRKPAKPGNETQATIDEIGIKA